MAKNSEYLNARATVREMLNMLAPWPNGCEDCEGICAGLESEIAEVVRLGQEFFKNEAIANEH